MVPQGYIATAQSDSVLLCTTIGSEISYLGPEADFWVYTLSPNTLLVYIYGSCMLFCTSVYSAGTIDATRDLSRFLGRAKLH